MAEQKHRMVQVHAEDLSILLNLAAVARACGLVGDNDRATIEAVDRGEAALINVADSAALDGLLTFIDVDLHDNLCFSDADHALLRRLSELLLARFEPSADAEGVGLHG